MSLLSKTLYLLFKYSKFSFMLEKTLNTFSATFPNSVSFPVAMTTPFPLPFVTTVPANAIFTLSANSVFFSKVSILLFLGLVSPC